MLIKCPECEKEISDKALACPNCGYPINNSNINITNEKQIEYNDISTNLSIGEKYDGKVWGGIGSTIGSLDKSKNIVDIGFDGKCMIQIFDKGISIFSDANKENHFDIHDSQIIKVFKSTQEDLILQNKSVIGRAAAGGLLLGPFGAIIGGMSGLGTKSKSKKSVFLIINYKLSKNNEPASLVFDGTFFLDGFMKLYDYKMKD